MSFPRGLISISCFLVLALPLAVLPADEATPRGGKESPQPADAELMLRVERATAARPCPLHTKVAINHQRVGVFTTESQQAIGKYLKRGWNTITLETTAQPTDRGNDLILQIGPVHKDPKKDRPVMKPVFWEFHNGTDWRLDEKTGRYSHRKDPQLKQVTLSFPVYFAGMEHERWALQAGDYFLEVRPQLSHRTVPVTLTAYVNGTPLNSFVLRRRQLILTPLLKEGKNELRIVSNRVADVISGNKMELIVAGPAEYGAKDEKFHGRQLTQFDSMTGWSRGADGQLVNKAKPGSDTVETVLTFTLDQPPPPAKK